MQVLVVKYPKSRVNDQAFEELEGQLSTLGVKALRFAFDGNAATAPILDVYHLAVRGEGTPLDQFERDHMKLGTIMATKKGSPKTPGKVRTDRVKG